VPFNHITGPVSLSTGNLSDLAFTGTFKQFNILGHPTLLESGGDGQAFPFGKI
jgi:hypothetical protein